MAPNDREERGAPTIPAQLGPYRIKKRLGGGGMGTVYLVENTKLEREEALKIPHLEQAGDPEMKKRFLVEARAAAKLDHPNLCQVYDADEIDGQLYMTMRYLKGRPLSDYAGAPQPPRKAVEVVTKLAQALEYAHSKGVIHRDLKPNNVMMCPGSGPTVMDFGLARRQDDRRLTQMGTMLGTPNYMPPEQVKGDLARMGPGSDVYSLGVILYELLTGRLPFEGAMAEVFGKILYTEPPPPSQLRPELKAALDAICGKAMAKDPAQRYPSMKSFAAALVDYLKATPAMEGTGALVLNPAAVKAAGSPVPPPPNIFQAQTMVPGQGPRSDTFGPRDTAGAVETRVGGKPPSSVRPAGGKSSKRLQPDRRRQEESSGSSVGGILMLLLCAFLILGALGGVGGLIYALREKRAQSTDEVVQPIEPVEPVASKSPRLSLETPPALEIGAGESLSFVVKISREHFTEAVRLSFKGLPPGGQVGEILIPAGSVQGRAELVVDKSAAAGSCELVVLAESANPSVPVSNEARIPLKISAAATPTPVTPTPRPTETTTDPGLLTVGSVWKGEDVQVLQTSTATFPVELRITSRTGAAFAGVLYRTGTKGRTATLKVNGTVAGSTVVWEVRSGTSPRILAKYTGALDGTTLKGEWVSGARVTGTSTSKKTFSYILQKGDKLKPVDVAKEPVKEPEKESEKKDDPVEVLRKGQDFKSVAAGTLPKGWAGDPINVCVQKHDDRVGLEMLSGALQAVKLPFIQLDGPFRLETDVAIPSLRSSVIYQFDTGPKKFFLVRIADTGKITIGAITLDAGKKWKLLGAVNKVLLERTKENFLVKVSGEEIGAVPLALVPGTVSYVRIGLEVDARGRTNKSPRVHYVRLAPVKSD
jgi:serine/threonine protein kinase